MPTAFKPIVDQHIVLTDKYKYLLLAQFVEFHGWNIFHPNTATTKEVDMKLLKKLAITVHSHVESLSDRIENKEALSVAYIREYERVVAKAKVRSAQVDREVVRLEKEAVRLREQEALWAERARRVHATDENKALSCIARMTQVQAAYRQVQDDLEEAGSLKHKMARDVEHILKRLEALKRRHRNLSGRQACAEAACAIQNADGGIQNDIDNLLARWETDVAAQELCGKTAPESCDLLLEEFETTEKKEALRRTLNQIIATPSQKGEENQ